MHTYSKHDSKSLILTIPFRVIRHLKIYSTKVSAMHGVWYIPLIFCMVFYVELYLISLDVIYAEVDATSNFMNISIHTSLSIINATKIDGGRMK